MNIKGPTCIVYLCKRQVHEYECLLCQYHCEHTGRRMAWWRRPLIWLHNWLS